MMGQKTTVPLVRIVALLAMCIMLLSTCAGMDDFLETSLDQEPTVIFECALYEDDQDTLVLLGVKNPYVYNKSVQARSLQFYLKNDNGDLPVSHIDHDDSSAFLQLTEIPGDTLEKVYHEFPSLQGLQVYGLILRDMSVDEEKLKEYETLEDGAHRHLTVRNSKLINAEETVFAVESLGDQESDVYEGIITDIFEPED